MSRIKNSDCVTCGEWLGECECLDWDFCPDIPEGELIEMQEECYQHFTCTDGDSEPLPF